MRPTRFWSVLALVVAAAALDCRSGRADPAADFYRGRTVTILVGSGVSGGYDVYSRLLAKFWGDHIPGRPKLVVENMPGANGVTMMNYLVAEAAKDGSIIGAPFGADLTEPRVDKGKYTRYDPRRLSWIGNVAPQYNGCFVRSDSPVKSLEDARKIPTHLSASGANSNAAVMANVYNALLGTKFQVVMGYPTSQMILAVERKEVDGACISYDNLLASRPDLIDKGLIRWLIVLNDAPVRELPGTPPATEFARSEEARQMLEFLIARNLQGRPYVVAPGVPPERVAALRTSFQDTMRDPGFLADAKRLRLAVDPSDHVAMEQMIARVYAMPESAIEKTIELTKSR